MAPPPTKSNVTGNDVPAHYIHADTAYFRDVHGRSLLLRGVNLSGSCKAPVGEPSQKLKGFWEAGESGDMSFVGRPLDLEDGPADVSCVVWVFIACRVLIPCSGASRTITRVGIQLLAICIHLGSYRTRWTVSGNEITVNSDRLTMTTMQWKD